MQDLNYSIRYSVVQINFPLLTIMLYSFVRTTFIYDNTKYSAPFMSQLSLTVSSCH